MNILRVYELLATVKFTKNLFWIKKLQIFKVGYVQEKLRTFFTLELSNFVASVLFEVNFFDFAVGYQVPQTSEK